MSEEMKMVLDQLKLMNGKIDHLTDDVSGLKNDVAILKTDVAGLKNDVAILKTDVAGLKNDVAILKTDVAGLKNDVAILKTDVAELKTDVATLKTDVTNLRTDVEDLKQRDRQREDELHTIKLLLENEIRPSIRIIAEGHLDLKRKLDEALQIRNQDENLHLRVSVLESEVRELKKRVDKGPT